MPGGKNNKPNRDGDRKEFTLHICSRSIESKPWLSLLAGPQEHCREYRRGLRAAGILLMLLSNAQAGLEAQSPPSGLEGQWLPGNTEVSRAGSEHLR